jgi:hypothetical protein
LYEGEHLLEKEVGDDVLRELGALPCFKRLHSFTAFCGWRWG